MFVRGKKKLATELEGPNPGGIEANLSMYVCVCVCSIWTAKQLISVWLGMTNNAHYHLAVWWLVGSVWFSWFVCCHLFVITHPPVFFFSYPEASSYSHPPHPPFLFCLFGGLDFLCVFCVKFTLYLPTASLLFLQLHYRHQNNSWQNKTHSWSVWALHVTSRQQVNDSARLQEKFVKGSVILQCYLL